MTITDRQLAKKYGISVQTLNNYKRGSEGKRALYAAMRHYYSVPAGLEMDLSLLSRKALHDLHDYLSTSVQNDARRLQNIAARLQNIK